MFDSLFPSHWTTLRKLMWLKLKGASAVWDTITGNPVSFTAKAAPLKQLSVAFSPVQSGTGDPSPDNVRPISGWTNLTVEQAGKNLLQLKGRRVVTTVSGTTRDFSEPSLYIGETPNNYHDANRVASYSVSDDSVTVNMNSASGYGLGFNVKVKPNTDYYGSYDGWETNTYTLGFYDEGGNYLGFKQWDARKFTTPDKCTNLMVVLRTFTTGADVTFKEPYLVFGTEAVAYTPYNPLSRSISISLGQTVYSGYVDVVTGVVTATRRARQINDIAFTYYANGGYFRTGATAGYDTSAEPIAEAYLGDTSISSSTPTGRIGFAGTRLAIVDKRYTSTDDLYADVGTTYVLLPLATPVTYQLTPQEVSSLLGENVMWSDANGNLTVEYRSN